jgi:ABC-type Fe3+ transport system permease subunit
MFGWLRVTARGVCGLLRFLPALALVVAVVVDRGPGGEVRFSPHLLPAVLWIFDDFAWTCARNSLIFAVVVALASLIAGVGVSWALARRRTWGGSVLRGMVGALIAAHPALLALGITGWAGEPHPWPWPFAAMPADGPGVSLESWAGLTLWAVWVWTTLPAAAALVALAAAGPIERLERSWEDAARLAGAGAFGIWRSLSWPLVRPAALRAAGLVFVIALVEPGAPLVLGLRRTLAFQIVESAGRPDPFPRVAVWALMAGLYAWAGWILLRWRAGVPLRDNLPGSAAMAGDNRNLPRQLPVVALVPAAGAAAWCLGGWFPVGGLVLLAAGRASDAGASSGGGIHALIERAQRIAEPPVLQLATNSLIFGVMVACTIMALAWLVEPGTRNPPAKARWWRFVAPLAALPPLLLGAGTLALPWLVGLAARSFSDAGSPRLGHALEALGAALDPYRTPWILMAAALVLAIAPALLASWRGGAGAPIRCPSAADAALLAGASRTRARGFGSSRLPGRWLGRFILVWALAATNLTPSLLFAPWSDWRTVLPGAVVLARGGAEDRAGAAALALGALAVNVGALVVARVTKALPRWACLE